MISIVMVHVTASLHIRDLGRTTYATALEVQRRTHEAILADAGSPTLLLLEHDPVITISRRKNTRQHLLASSDRLSELGIDVQPTDRGGDITYHGPGQLVAYPIIPLGPLGLNVGLYMHGLEQIVIQTLATFHITAQRTPGCTGVWIDGDPAKKICALGVRVRRNVTMHGLALNVAPDMSHFDTIVPCGLALKSVISMQQLLGDRTPAMHQVKSVLISVMQAHFGCSGDRDVA